MDTVVGQGSAARWIEQSDESEGSRLKTLARVGHAHAAPEYSASGKRVRDPIHWILELAPVI